MASAWRARGWHRAAGLLPTGSAAAGQRLRAYGGLDVLAGALVPAACCSPRNGRGFGGSIGKPPPRAEGKRCMPSRPAVGSVGLRHPYVHLPWSDVGALAVVGLLLPAAPLPACSLGHDTSQPLR